MWKYVVTWLIIKITLAVCPPSETMEDEFGRIRQPDQEEMLGCYKTDTTKKEKYFDTRKEATDFIKRGQDRKAQGLHSVHNIGVLDEFRLDSIPSIQYNCSHPSFTKTLLACIGDPCNTATCMRCGKEWLTY